MLLQKGDIMPSFGRKSSQNLLEAHPALQRLFKEVVKHYDCSVIEGHRPRVEQDKAFHAGRSKVKWPGSKHNTTPSMAVDVCPYPISWSDMNQFYHFSGYVKATADQMGIAIRCGSDWDGDNDFKDQSFHDMPHFELIRPNPIQVTAPTKDVLPAEITSNQIDAVLRELEKEVFD